MAQETFKELVCGEDGFRVRAKTEAEVLKHVKIHVIDAHGAKEITPCQEVSDVLTAAQQFDAQFLIRRRTRQPAYENNAARVRA